MSIPFNFSNLQTSTSASSGSQLLLRLDTALSGAPGFARITSLDFEKSLGVYSAVQTNSGYWQDTYTGFSTQSANNASVYSTVQSNSATNWNYQGTDIRALTANWQNTYTAFGAQSAGNISVYSNVNSNSANWQSVYTVYSATSADLASLYTTVQTNSATNWRGLTIFTQVSSILTPNSAIPVHGLSAISLSSSVDFAIIPTLSGALLAQIPDNTIANGNKRGPYATDWQRYRTNSNSARVASGLFSTIGGGSNNSATNEITTVAGGNSNQAIGLGSTINGGANNSANGNYSTIIGGSNNTTTSPAENAIACGSRSSSRLAGQFSHANGQFAAVGDAQFVKWIARNTTSDNTPTLLYLNGSSIRITLQSGYVYSLNFKIIGTKNNGDLISEYNKKAIAKNLGGTSSLVDVVDITPPFESSPPTDCTITVSNTTDTIDITVTGIIGEDWRWCAVVEGIEMKYTT